MSKDASTSGDSDTQFCWDQVLRIRPQFRLSHPYAPRAIADALLAVHAFLASFEEIVAKVEDENVSRAKLTWWQQELAAQNFAGSQHPIVRVLRRSMDLPVNLHFNLQRLLEFSLDRIDCAAPPDAAALSQLCGKLGYYPMRLEFSLEAEEESDQAATTRDCVVTGLLQLLRESARTEHRAYWWVPLNLLARFGLSRNEISSDKVDSPKDLLKQVCHGVLESHSDQAAGKVSARQVDSSRASLFSGHRHWCVQSSLQTRLLSRLQNTLPKRHLTVFSSNRPIDAWHAWRAARQWTEKERTG